MQYDSHNKKLLHDSILKCYQMKQMHIHMYKCTNAQLTIKNGIFVL